MPDPRCLLVAEVLRRFGRARLRVWGGSMAPTVPPGSLVEVAARDFSRVVAGQLVVFSRDSRLFVHRCLSRSQDEQGPWMLTRGDGLMECDAPVRPSEFLGCVVAVRTAPWLARWRDLRGLLGGFRRRLATGA